MKPKKFEAFVGAVSEEAAAIYKSSVDTVTEESLLEYLAKTANDVIAGNAPAAPGMQKNVIPMSDANEQALTELVKAAAAEQFEIFKTEQEGEDLADQALEKLQAQKDMRAVKNMTPSERSPLRESPLNGGTDAVTDAAIAKKIEMMPLSKYHQRPLDEFSLMRLLKAISTNDWGAAQLEKGLSGNSDQDGGFTIPDVISDQMIMFLRERNVVLNAGARTMPMTSDTLIIPVLARGTSAHWLGLQGQQFQESQVPDFNIRQLNAKRLTALLPITNELLDDTSFNLEQIFMEDMANNIAEEEDKAWLVGQGTTEPVGIVNFPDVDISAANVNLGAIDIDTIRALILQCRLAFAVPTAIITHPTVTDTLMSLKDANGRPLLNTDVHDGDNLRMHGLPIFDSVNCIQPISGNFPIIVAPMAEVRIGERSAIELDADQSIGFKENVLWTRGIRRVDLTIGHPETVIVQEVVNV